MSNNAPSQGPGAQGQQQQPLIRVHQIANMPHLDEQAKQKYAAGIQRLWTILQENAPESDEYKQAHARLVDASLKLKMSLRSYQENQLKAQGGAQGGQQGASGGGRPQSGGQPTAAQQQQQPPQQNQPQQQMNTQPTMQQIPPQIMHHVQGFHFVCPPELTPGSPEANQYLATLKQTYLQALVKQEQARTAIAQVTKLVSERKAQGQDVPADVMTQKAQFEQSYNKNKTFVDEVRSKQAVWKNQREQQQASGAQVKTEGGANVPNPAPAQQFNLQMPPQRQHSQGHGGAAPPVNPALDATRNQSNAGRTSQSPATSGPSGPPQQQQAPAPAFPQQQQQQQPPPTSGAPSMPLPQQQQPRPQLNPQQAAHLNPASQNSPHAQTGNPQGPPIPLTHQAAINTSNAQRTYSGPPQPASAQAQQAPAGYHGLGSREQMNNPKMPIPKVLPVAPPQPVHMGSPRPTMGGPSNGVGPGVMGQPVINKPAGFVMEGEARSVLTKSRLDELVRQVTGGEGGGLAPEVEEIMYQLADEFVDDVTTSACRLAKLRDSSTLDIRDLQLVLERNYNIRIPGYAADEVRTVRKFAPAPGWTAKMNAVQAAKIEDAEMVRVGRKVGLWEEEGDVDEAEQVEQVEQLHGRAQAGTTRVTASPENTPVKAERSSKRVRFDVKEESEGRDIKQESPESSRTIKRETSG